MKNVLIFLGVCFIIGVCVSECDEPEENTFEYFYKKGLDENSKNNFRGAIIYFNEALSLNPASNDAYYNRGYANIQLGYNDEACNDWHKAEELGHVAARKSIDKHCNEKKLFNSKDDFQNAFNNFSQSNQLDLLIRGFNCDENKLCTSMLNEHIQIMCAYNDDNNSIKKVGVTMVGGSDNTALTQETIVCMIGIIAITNANINIESRQEIISILSKKSKAADIGNFNVSTIKNGVEYILQMTQGVGVLFVAIPS